MAVLEITTKSVVRRPAEEWFLRLHESFSLAGAWGRPRACRRYELLPGRLTVQKLTLDDLAQKLDQVNQGKLTIQTMIFEPSFAAAAPGDGPRHPSRHKPLELIELAPLLKQRSREVSARRLHGAGAGAG